MTRPLSKLHTCPLPLASPRGKRTNANACSAQSWSSTQPRALALLAPSHASLPRQVLYLALKYTHEDLHAKDADVDSPEKMAPTMGSAMGWSPELVKLMQKTMHGMTLAMDKELDAKIGYAYVVETKRVLSKADLAAPHIEPFIRGPCTVVFVPNTVKAFAVEAGEIGQEEPIDIKNPNY